MDDEEDGARRFWMYPKGTCSPDPLVQVFPGGDEYGNSTIQLRLPGGRAFLMAYNWPLRRELEAFEGRVEYGWVDDGDFAPWHNPCPIDPQSIESCMAADGLTVVTREVWYGRWEAMLVPICPTSCDDDCEVDCHEGHQVIPKRKHDPETCPGAHESGLNLRARHHPEKFV